jgi:hypothetical protein
MRNFGWSHLSNVNVGSASEISCIAISKVPANRLYYGTNLGKVFRLDGANAGNPVPVNIMGKNFPANGFIAVGTHGNGVYSTYFNNTVGIDRVQAAYSLQVGNIFPNPVKNDAKLEVISEKTVKLRTTVYSGTGQLVKRLPDKFLQPGKQYLSLQFGELQPGVYCLTLEAGKKVVVKKFVKIEN